MSEKNSQPGVLNAENKETNKKWSESRQNAQLVHEWYQSYYLWTSTVMASSILNSNLINHGTRVLNIPVNNAFNVSPTTSVNSPTPTNLNQAPPPVVSNPQPTRPQPTVITIFKIPSLIRRLMAESIDALYIQLVKVVFALILLNYTELISEDSFRLFDLIEEILTEDNINNIRLPVELLLLETVCVLISVGFESYCLYRKGYTPGKYLLNLRVVSCNQINELITPGHVQIQPGTKLSLKATLIRSCLKNFSIVFLFPTIIFFFLPAFMEFGQTSYDKVSESIVVQNIS